MALFGYTCECEYRRCRRKLFLETHEYDHLARIGNVLHIDHMNGIDVLNLDVRPIRTAFARAMASPSARSGPPATSLDGQDAPRNGSATGPEKPVEPRLRIGVKVFDE